LNIVPSNKTKSTNIIKKIFHLRESTLVLLIVIAGIILTIANENFFSITNMRVIVQGLSTDMIVGVAVCISLIGGNIDFSVGSIIGFSGIVCALLLNNHYPIYLAIMIGLLGGTLLGLINGLIVTRLKLLPFVATIGTWMAYKALDLVISNGKTAASLPIAFKSLAQGTTFGLPNTVVVMLIVVIIGLFLIRKIDFFHKAYYIGGNKKSAELAGINVKRFTVIMYMITGFAAGLAGILLAGRLGNADSLAGQGTEFRLVVALLIGGISFDGGEGTLIGAVLGIILMGIVQNAMVMLSINPYWTEFFTGSILIAAVALDAYNKARRRKE
jgi:ribose/xylose/arabinose/galactoside ABC-type transport system permease subunit